MGRWKAWPVPMAPTGSRRLVIATTDPATLPEPATWYLATTLPLERGRPGRDRPPLRACATGSSSSTSRSRAVPGLEPVPGARRSGHAPALGAGAVRLCLLLVGGDRAARIRTGRRPSPTTPQRRHRQSHPGERGKRWRARRCRPGPGPGAAGRVALRRVRAWLEPAWVLWRCWRAWSDQPPPAAAPGAAGLARRRPSPHRSMTPRERCQQSTVRAGCG